MYLPYVNTPRKTRDYQTAFLGYNHTENCRDGEFFDMENMTSDLYPVLSPRGKRGKYPYPEGTEAFRAEAMIGKDALCYVSKGKFYINNYPVEGFEIEETPQGKSMQLVSTGAYVVIFPQRQWVNTITHEHGFIDNVFSTKDKDVKYTLAKSDGTAYENLPSEPPSEDDLKNGSMYIDLAADPIVVRIYSDSSKSWTSVPTTYVKIQCEGIGDGFKPGDGINISGIENEIAEKLNGSHVIFDVGGNYITVIGIIGNEVSAKGITVERKAPDMDFVIESNNRLWGCKYGETDQGVVNSIYASALGDFKNWNVFQGIASDSYALPIGTDGYFTGAITYQGIPLFFKEKCLHVVYGTAPSNYQLQTTVGEGVENGSYKSLAIVNNILFYKGVNGIYGYDGSLPQFVSPQFGSVLYENGVGGAYNNKYYVSLKLKNKPEFALFVFDTKKGMWHKEDGLQVLEFCENSNNLYFICEEDDFIHAISGSDEEGRIKWSAETGIIGKETPDKKYLTKITARVKIVPGSRVHVYAEYDSMGGWRHLFAMDGKALKTVSVPVRLNRCDHVRLKFEGIGDAQIYSLSKTVCEGTER